MGKLKLEQVGKNEWRFVLPESSEKADDLLFESQDYTEDGNLSKAKMILNKAIEIFPQHIDAINQLGMMSGKDMKKFNEQAVNIGLSVLPSKFNEKSKLEWGWMENRPFLRAYHTKGLMLLEEGKLDEAIKIFNQMISWNTNDNQGVRDILADIYSGQNMIDEMIHLSSKYPRDYSPSMNFGLALALYKKGEKEKANKALKKAIDNFPLCGKILLEESPKKPKSEMPGYISVGGADQAYEFWEGNMVAWKDKEIREWLKSHLNAKSDYSKGR